MIPKGCVPPWSQTPRYPLTLLGRWLAFTSVGIMGAVVQLGTLLALTELVGAHYLFSTALAVEAAVLHNFQWHEHWTWADRARPAGTGVLRRLLQFNLTTGAVSIVGNLILMHAFVGVLNLNYALANLLAIVLCSVLNFLFNHRFIFTPTPTFSPPAGVGEPLAPWTLRARGD